MATMPVPGNRQRGAALLLLVSALGMGTASFALQVLSRQQLDLRHEQQTSIELAAAREALIGFALRHGRLPRPAISELDGRERERPCDQPRDCTGLLPWVTLGIAGADDWGKRLRYSVTPALSARGFDITSTVADKRVMTRGADGKLAYLRGGTTCEVTAQCLAAVVFSSGSKNLGTSVAGVAQANSVSGNLDEQYNNTAVNDFISREASTDPARPGGEFDDMVSWIALPPLYQQMARAGTLQTRP